MSLRPTYKGRPLPRPDEDIEDQGLAFDVGTLLARRSILSAGGIGLLGLGLAACGNTSSPATTAAASGTTATTAAAATSAATAASATASAAGLTEVPDETAGPYPGDGSNGVDVLEESGIIRQDLTKSFGDASGTAAGVPLTLELTILDIANGGAAFKDVAVYAWHADQNGEYSMYSEAIKDENYLRGVQIANENGTVTYKTIFPACYDGRWPHIHFEVYPDTSKITDAANAISTSQVALPKDACEAVYATTGYEQSVTNLSKVSLATDNVFGDDGGIHQLAAVSGNAKDGYTAKLTVAVDTSTQPTGGAAPGTPPGGTAGAPPAGGPGGPSSTATNS